MPEDVVVGGNNVVRLARPPKPVVVTTRQSTDGGGGSGDGMPPDDLLERVRNRESAMLELRQELKGIADRLDELARGRDWGHMQERLQHVATRADIAELSSRLDHQHAELAGRIERQLGGLTGKVSQRPNGWQVFLGLFTVMAVETSLNCAIIRWGVRS